MKFVDVKNDVAFRKIFGNEHKTSIIISFLNAVLNLQGDESIEEVSFVNPYQLPRLAGEKASIIDVRAKDLKGRQFVIEMQVADVDGFGKRVQYYACRDYSMQINRGDEYSLLKPTYFIGILDFNYFDSEDYLSNHIILNGKTLEHKLKDIQFTFVELRKFRLSIDELQTLTEKWIFFIKNVTNLSVIPNHVKDEGLRAAYLDADKHNWEKEELITYDNTFIAEQDARGRVTAAVNKAVNKAVNQEIEKVIERCWQKDMSLEEIAKIVELPLDEVKIIIKKFK